mgnify:CR=1 FL=1
MQLDLLVTTPCSDVIKIVPVNSCPKKCACVAVDVMAHANFTPHYLGECLLKNEIEHCIGFSANGAFQRAARRLLTLPSSKVGVRKLKKTGSCSGFELVVRGTCAMRCC